MVIHSHDVLVQGYDKEITTVYKQLSINQMQVTTKQSHELCQNS